MSDDKDLSEIYAFKTKNWYMEKQSAPNSCTNTTTAPTYTLDPNTNTATIQSTLCWGLFASNSQQRFSGGTYQFSFDIECTVNAKYVPFSQPFFKVRNFQNTFAFTNQTKQTFVIDIPPCHPTEVIFNFDSKYAGKNQTFTISNFVVTKLTDCSYLPLSVTSDIIGTSSWSTQSTDKTVKPPVIGSNNAVTFSSPNQNVTTIMKANGYYKVYGIANGELEFSIADPAWSSTVTPDKNTNQFVVQIPMEKCQALQVSSSKATTTQNISFQILSMDCVPLPKPPKKGWTKPWMVYASIAVIVILLIIVIVVGLKKQSVSISQN